MHNHSVEQDSRNKMDELLLAKAQQGDERALSSLIRRFIPLVRSRAYSFSNSGLEHDDLMQEGYIGLLSSIRFYSKDEPSSFRTYARICVDRSIISAIRRSKSKKRIPSHALVSMSDSSIPADFTFLSDMSDPQTALTNKDELELLRFRISRSLSTFERRVLSGYLLGSSYQDIAAELGTSVKAVDNALWRIRRKLR